MRGLESVQPQLVDQIRNASIHHWTYDPSSGADAIYIYVVPHRDLNAAEQNVIGLRHGESIPVEARRGMIVVDTDNFGRVAGIEVLFRKDVAEVLTDMKVANNDA